MSTFLGSVWWMIVSIGVLVTFHEFGHYWVARRCGVPKPTEKRSTRTPQRRATQ